MPAPTLKDNWQAQHRALKPNWDSYNGKAISEAAIAALEAFAVIPCPDGGLQIETHQDGFDLEIEIDAEGKIEGILFQRNLSSYPAGRSD